jgi:tetratricopeptide (TPR) repeat protein
LSKLSTLKQEAYQAGKKKDWARAIALYEQILERDKNNPTVINELGDLCLKGGETNRAVRHFLSAASKYRSNGLLNNAVAIYKKILRHDAENLNAHWYLAETRASQGLMVEGENHAIHFLDNSENVAGDIKEIFLKRCRSLFELFPESRVILSRLGQIFNMWSLRLEAARASCLVLCLDFAGGKQDEARAAMDGVTAKVPEVMNYPEFAKWTVLLDPNAEPSAGRAGAFSDFGAVSLDDQPAAAPPPAPAAPEAPAGKGSFGDVTIDDAPPASAPAARVEIPAPQPAAPDAADPELDDEGCFEIDDDGGDLDDLVARAAGEVAAREPEAEDLAPLNDPGDVLLDRPDAGGGHDRTAGPKVDLLAQMLEEEGPDLIADATGQMETITSEISSVVGADGGEDDAERLYEMGMVYLEMGMFDQACESFETAAADDAFTARAHEMWGITLQRANRAKEAIEVLNRGIGYVAKNSREHHGLLYHLGMAHETNGDVPQAIDCFRTINDVDPGYLDVGRRLARLTAV